MDQEIKILNLEVQKIKELERSLKIKSIELNSLKHKTSASNTTKSIT